MRPSPHKIHIPTVERLQDFGKLRARGYNVRKAADRLGVTDRTGWRYEAALSAASGRPMIVLDYMPTWDGLGPCVGQPETMYPNNEAETRAARTICRSCPVLAKCRDWVQALPWRSDPGGVIAGMTLEERSHPDQDVPGVKRCPSCEQVLPFAEFAPVVRGGPRLKSHCRACERRGDVKRRQAAAPVEAAPDAAPGELVKRCPRCQTMRGVSRFYPHKANTDGLSVWCKPCFIEKGSE